MSRVTLALFTVVLLAACETGGGTHRAPEPKAKPETGVRISGYARAGISVSRGNVDPIGF